MPFFGIVPLFQPIPYIKLTYEAEEINPFFIGGLFENMERYLHILIPDNIDPSCAGVIKNEANNELIVILDPQKVNIKQEEAWKALRISRDQLLINTDRFLLPDYPIITDNRNSVIAYRQALRDLPNNTIDPTTPEWPIKPIFTN